MSEIFILDRCPYCGTDYYPISKKPRHTSDCPLYLDQVRAKAAFDRAKESASGL